jgi:hypothetical protein
MNHFKLSYTKDKDNATSIYGNVATLALIQMMIEDGSKLKHLEAQIFGGSIISRFVPRISAWKTPKSPEGYWFERVCPSFRKMSEG